MAIWKSVQKIFLFEFFNGWNLFSPTEWDIVSLRGGGGGGLEPTLTCSFDRETSGISLRHPLLPSVTLGCYSDVGGGGGGRGRGRESFSIFPSHSPPMRTSSPLQVVSVTICEKTTLHRSPSSSMVRILTYLIRFFLFLNSPHRGDFLEAFRTFEAKIYFFFL